MFESIFGLAVVQSLTEFLPVSSSAHLILMQKFGFSNQSFIMDLGLHVGSLVAVMAFFWRDIWRLIVGFWRKGPEQTLGLQLIVATIPALFVGFFLSRYEPVLRVPLVIAGTSIFYGVLLWWADKRSPVNKSLSDMTYRSALWIGVAQSLALVPGTSRSGVTMTCARFFGFNRVDSARFSMLMSIPVILAATVYESAKALMNDSLSVSDLSELSMAVQVSAVLGFVAVWGIMRWLRRSSFAVFAVYRVLLGIVCLLFFL